MLTALVIFFALGLVAAIRSVRAPRYAQDDHLFRRRAGATKRNGGRVLGMYEIVVTAADSDQAPSPGDDWAALGRLSTSALLRRD
jgi:hypothetical protein